MNKKTGIVLILLLVISIFANIFAYIIRGDTYGPITGDYPQLKDASIAVGIGGDGEVNFFSPKDKELKSVKVGIKRPINIEKFLPGKVIKTIDNIVIFSGSPNCAWHDGRLICAQE